MATVRRDLSTAPSLISVRGLRKSYAGVEALRGVDLDVRSGEVVVVMGPSGCGKSTLVRCLNRLVEPDSGRIEFDGVDLTATDRQGLAAVRRRIGFVFQHSNLIERLTALDNVALGLVMAGMPIEKARAKAREALGMVGLAAKEQRQPSDMSGGERQRVGIARALAQEPELMLWDEPTASLDPLLVREVLDVMEELVKTGGTTMLIVTHEVPFALRAADRVILIDRGTVAEDGPPREVFSTPQSALGAKYRELIETYLSAGELVANGSTEGVSTGRPVSDAADERGSTGMTKRKSQPGVEKPQGIPA